MLVRTPGLAILLATVLAACSPPQKQPPADPASAPATPVTTPTQAPNLPDGEASIPTMISCEAQIGAGPAKVLVDRCRSVSPATRPPCNAANSCALIRDEIARSCSLFGADADRTPGCDTAPTSAEAAADVVRRYYEAIAARDYATAYSQWGDDGKHSGQTYESFAAGFARTRSVTPTIGTASDIEGAAGSLYVTVPITLDAVQNDGTRQHFTGEYVIRRVNNVDGASAEQLRWHIGSASLQPVK